MDIQPIWLAGLAGICFSFIGTGYRLGANYRIHELHMMGVVALAGAAVFSTRFVQVGSGISWVAIAAGILGGVTQYGTVYGIRRGLTYGPLTAIWCALMLNFIPVILYARLFLQEQITLWHIGAMVTGTACVFMASTLSFSPTSKSDGSTKPGRTFTFGLVLLSVLILNSFNIIGMKYLATVKMADGLSIMDRHGDLFRATGYIALLASILIDQVFLRRPVNNPRMLGIIGLIAGAGSVGGVWLLCRAAGAAAGSVFVMNTVCGIIATAVAGTLFFGERRVGAGMQQ